MPSDMRSWIAQLDDAGLLARIVRPVDPRTEMGALLWQARDRALLFENLTGFAGWRSLAQAPGDVTLAPVAFGTTRDEMVPEFVRRTEKSGSTHLVKTGPVKERVLIGDNADLTKMPIHQSGVRDGGPFRIGPHDQQESRNRTTQLELSPTAAQRAAKDRHPALPATRLGELSAL